jgi:antitoxin (DNA-binding transcriptional repressor) of toxin-antitoxin stability system
MATASVRDLRNHFPRIKKIVETEGEVIVTDKGQPKYKLTLYTPEQPVKATPAKDYMARLRRYQPRVLTVAEAKSLIDENRGDR